MNLTPIQLMAHNALFELVVRDHGGCDDDECHLRQAIEDMDTDEAIFSWACSGAACDRFNRIYERFLEVKQ